MDKLISGARALGIELSARQLAQFEAYYQALVEWNQRVNLTAITDYGEVQTKHFLDSLTVTMAMPIMAMTDMAPTDRLVVIDVGTGAGLPGVPLKIVWPALRLALLESRAKKADFLRYLVGTLGLTDVDILVGRAEEVARQPRYREQFGLVLSRAVAALPSLVELALPFCAVGGRFVAQKQADALPEVDEAAGALAVLGGRLGGVIEVSVPGLPGDRRLVIIDKVAPTPPAYPRRPGIPAKRPLR